MEECHALARGGAETRRRVKAALRARFIAFLREPDDPPLHSDLERDQTDGWGREPPPQSAAA